MNSFLENISQNILHVLPIIVCAVFAGGIIIERVKALFKTYPIQNPVAFFDKVQELLYCGKTSEAIALCDRIQEKPIARVVKSGILRAHQPENLIEHGLQLAVTDAQSTIQKRTNFLATIANVVTLLGLFGTIAGLIHSFEAVGHADPQQKSALLAAGISTAMNATMMGLAVAIPCMVAFSFLMNRTNKLLTEVENAAVKTMDILKQRYFIAENELFHAPYKNQNSDHPNHPNQRGAA